MPPIEAAFNVDVLKVGHHGSHNATTATFVTAITPKIAVIQAGDSTLSQAIDSAPTALRTHTRMRSTCSSTRSTACR